MPIYEFKCLKCEEFFEILVMGGDEEKKMACPKCDSEDFERVLSTTNYNMPGGTSGGGGAAEQTGTTTRTCSGGSCTTYNIPGPK